MIELGQFFLDMQPIQSDIHQLGKQNNLIQ